MSVIINKLKVGKDLIVVDNETGKKRRLQYSDVEFNSDGWADASKYLPVDFDLVYLKIDKLERNIHGWSNGDKWDGIRMRLKYKVLLWKRHE